MGLDLFLHLNKSGRLFRAAGRTPSIPPMRDQRPAATFQTDLITAQNRQEKIMFRERLRPTSSSVSKFLFQWPWSWSGDGQISSKTYSPPRLAQACFDKSPSSVAMAFSSFNSFTVASIFVRLNSLIATPCTISKVCPLLRIGKEQIMPFSMP